MPDFSAPRPGDIIRPQGQAPTQPEPPAEVPAIVPGRPSAPEPAPPPQAPALPYAGVGLRLGALVIDIVVIAVVTSPLSLLLPAGSSGPLNAAAPPTSGAVVYVWTLRWAAWLAYNALLTSSSWQATLGKRVMGLKVVGLSGQVITVHQAFLRAGFQAISALILGVGFVLAFFDDQKQTLHDKVAGTLVIRAKSS